ncbi:c-type cytochrome domain-containing protein [Pareuzebyella sediminis]|uniref:c-type cytochrome domain-containing protein n=1 Tax=Pareuzebyella sediminis TaxID=2607998 RepID=UPI0011EF4A3F|nr:c-type cytochrome domain-containing protein [Pareuzebyella sediminis]
MTHTSKSLWLDYVILGLSIFLIFCLLFDSYIELPVILAWLGRWHPVVLHFPIVLLLIAVFLGLTGKTVPRVLLLAGVLSALVTAISGFFLGKEALVKGDLLYWHQWLGGGVALLASLWYALYGTRQGQGIYVKGIQVGLLIFIGLTGHYGGMVTHGEDFLALPADRKKNEIPENPNIYEHLVAVILDEHCVSCHNPNKQKGELLMNNYADLIKGGESGKTIVFGAPEKSEMIRRLHLPTEDEEHMPPDGKKPLNENEIKVLERWIALGASDTLRLNHVANTEPLVGLVKEMRAPDPMEKWLDLPQVADSTLKNLSSDYLTIERIAGNSNALSIDMYMPPEYDSSVITNLQRVANNIVELDLSAIPLGDEEMAVIGSFTNLEWLEIDKTPISDKQMENLASLKKLRLLKVFESSITDKSIPVLKNLTSLKNLYIWETGISASTLDELQRQRPGLSIENGFDKDISAFFTAADSIPKKEKE